MHISDSHVIELLVDVVDVQITFLLDLDTMKMFKFILDTDNVWLSSNIEGWDARLMNRRGHAYFEWKLEVLFTQSELVRLQRHFYHPNPDSLYSLMKRGAPGKTYPDVFTTWNRSRALPSSDND